MRVLLCLLSKQHVPNLLAIHHYRPDRLVLVESNHSRKEHFAAHLLDALQLGGLDYTNRPEEERFHIEPLESEDDLNAVRTALSRALNRYSGAEWLVNVTGGTKPMSIATYDFFNGLILRKVFSGRILYTNNASPGAIIDLDSHVSENVDHRVSIKQFLAGYGFESRKTDAKIAEGESRARCWWDCARAIAAEADASSLLSLNDDERKRARDKGLELAPDRLRTDGKTFWPSVAEALSLRLEDGCLTGPLDKYAVQFLTGGWLEVFLWGLLDRHAEALGIWDVRLGLEVGQKNPPSNNDFDVAFMLKHRLCMIECKSGSQSHDPATDILYKIEAVIQQFRALGVRSWLATTSPNVLDPKTGEIKASIQTRAEIHGCKTILTEDIRRLAAAPDDGKLVKELFHL